MKYILQVISVFVISMLSSQSSAEISKKYFDLLKLPEQCKGGVAGSGERESVEHEQFFIETQEEVAGVQMETAKIQFDYCLTTRQSSDLETSKHPMSEALNRLQQSVTDRFQIADAALLAGCLDVADEEYREILKIYSRPSDQAVRDRAKIGIDDVRAKRAR